MSLNEMKKRIAETTDVLFDKTKELSQKTAESASKGLKSVSDIAHQAHHDMRLAYYNPVFPEDYTDSQFDLPDMIVIEDEDARKCIDVCEGSIGWLSKEAGVEVLHLYKEFVALSGLNFFPMINCDAVYYSDTFDNKRFIDLSSYYDVIQKDKMTELRNIAYSLGAKECRLESYEEEKMISRKKVRGKAKTKVNALGEFSSSKESSRKNSVLFEQKFEGSNNPVRPELTWYAHDKELLSLIDMRCSDSGSIQEYNIEINSSLSSTMSATRACKLDTALKKLGVVCNFSLESEYETESRRHLLFYIKF
ncbi:hypothetical protein [Adlercreutzia sp. ZJ154]|uniref:hypothetical protein n=1 Tax=Adlercreutzia sp. ZJ154 TaxID=2709790 RepID=UPI0013EA2941|nr:hypothetical protein [Adlercreutzia sp. ZJ154]